MAAKKKTLPQESPPSSSSDELESDEEPLVTPKPNIASIGKTATEQLPSSSSEEESEDESEEEEESSQPEVPVSTIKKQTLTRKKLPLAEEEESDDESEEEEEESSESALPVATKKEQSLARKEPPLVHKEQPSIQKEQPSTQKEQSLTQKRKETASTRKGPPLPSKEAPESGSEPEEEELSPKTTPTNSKKRKSITEKENEPVSVTSSAGKKLYQRLWTNEDEVTLIKMLAKYKKMHGKLPSTPTENGVFHEFVRSALHIEFSRIQLTKKIRTTKLKYYSNLAKTDNGKNNLQKDHEKLCFELSRKVWGDADLKKVQEDDDAGDIGGKDVTENGITKKRKKKTAAEAPKQEASLEEGRVVHSEILVSALDEMLTVFPYVSKVMHKYMNNAIGNMAAEEVHSFENELTLLNVNQLMLTKKRHAFFNKLLSAVTSKVDDSTCTESLDVELTGRQQG